MAPPSRLVQTRPSGHGRTRGLVSSRTSGRRIDAQSFAPREELADVVGVFWAGRWDLAGQSPHTTELLADPTVNLVFEASETNAGGRLVGVWTRLWRRTLEGRGRVRGTKLRAGALRAFVDAPAFQFTNRIVPLASLFGRAAHQIERAVLAPEDDAEGLACFGEWLLAHRRSADRAATELAIELAARIAADPEITAVDRLAKLAGLGPRALQRLFREHVGASPKWVIRVHRLQEVALRLERGEGFGLADLAAELGYTDQAHLSRDFKRAVGKTPSEFKLKVHR